MCVYIDKDIDVWMKSKVFVLGLFCFRGGRKQTP